MENEVAQAGTPAMFIEQAIQQNIDVEKLERLLALQERWQRDQARKLFFESLAGFQKDCPVIKKNKKTSFDGNRGKVEYSYATLDSIISQIKEPLHKHGLTYRWEFEEGEGNIGVTCIVTHVAGHSEKTQTNGKADQSGAKNDIQARGSTLTYLQRYTLIGALGIGTAQEDVDAQVSDFPDKEIKEAKTSDTLKKVWDAHVDLQKLPKFVRAINKRKNEIENEASKAAKETNPKMD